MTVSESEDYIRAKELVNRGDFDEFLQLMKQFKENESHSLPELVKWYLLECDILLQQSLFKELLEYSEKIYKKSLGLSKSLLSFDALYFHTYALIQLHDFVKAENSINESEALLNTLTYESLREFKKREAQIEELKGFFYFLSGNFNLAIKHTQQALKIVEKHGEKFEIVNHLIGICSIELVFKGRIDRTHDYIEKALKLAKESNRKQMVAASLFTKAVYHSFKGELDNGLNAYEESLVLRKELKNKIMIASTYNAMAENYRMKGELDRALEYSKQAVSLVKGHPFQEWFNYDNLIVILIEKGDLEAAKENLKKFELLDKKIKQKIYPFSSQYLTALILKSTPGVSNRVRAEEIFRQILSTDPPHELKLRALLNLSDLLLVELKATGNREVQDELYERFTQLRDIAEKAHSYWILGEIYLLQAKLELIMLNLKKARCHLTEGQQIAKKYGLNLLAKKISNEHDKILKQLNMWENLKQTEEPLEERIELAGIKEQMEILLRNRVISAPQLSEEEPVLLLIVSEGGTPFFSQSFIEDKSFEDHLFGGFFTAINSFINEKFSEGLDRASFGEHTLLMNSISPFLMCYVFKGQSYSAQQRVNYFIDKIQNDEPIWQTFRKFYKLNKEVQLKDIPSLEPLIKDIFIEKTIQLTS